MSLANIFASKSIPAFIKDGLPDICEQLHVLCLKGIEAAKTDGTVKFEEEKVIVDDKKDYDYYSDWSDSEDGDAEYEPDEDEVEFQKKDYYVSPIMATNEVQYLSQAIEVSEDGLFGNVPQ